MVKSMCEQNIEGPLWVVLEMQPLTRFKELYLPLVSNRSLLIILYKVASTDSGCICQAVDLSAEDSWMGQS